MVLNYEYIFFFLRSNKKVVNIFDEVLDVVILVEVIILNFSKNVLNKVLER